MDGRILLGAAALRKWPALGRGGKTGSDRLLATVSRSRWRAVALPRGSALSKRVDAAVGALLADGTIERLQRTWLTAHLDELPVLR